MNWMVRNSGGSKDAMLTFAVGGFLVAGLAVLSSFLDGVTIGSFHATFKTPDVALVSVFLAATLTSYVSRRNKKLDAEIEMKKIDAEKNADSEPYV